MTEFGGKFLSQNFPHGKTKSILNVWLPETSIIKIVITNMIILMVKMHLWHLSPQAVLVAIFQILVYLGAKYYILAEMLYILCEAKLKRKLSMEKKCQDDLMIRISSGFLSCGRSNSWTKDVKRCLGAIIITASSSSSSPPSSSTYLKWLDALRGSSPAGCNNGT